MVQEYTFAEIKVEVAENIGYDDGVGGILSSKDMTETIIGKYVNRRYYQLVSLLASKYPFDYEQVATADFWKAISTISIISSTILTSVDSIFNTGTIGNIIYNSTRSASATVSGYTSQTVVTLSAAPTGWAPGDTIYVLGSNGYVLGGDAAIARYPSRLALKYTTSDSFYTTAEERVRDSIYLTGAEIYTSTSPMWYKTNVLVGGIKKPAIDIFPAPTMPISAGIELRFVRLPDRLSAPTDIPELPLGSHAILIAGATADALKKLRRSMESPVYENDYKAGEQEVIASYSRSRINPTVGKRSQKTNNMRWRRI